MKRSRVNPVSGRRLAERPERRAVVQAVHDRDRYCVAERLVPQVRCGGPLDVHELIPRSAYPSGYLDVDNCALVCRAHHRWIDAEPAAAHDVGLHRFSWERRSGGLSALGSHP